MLLKAILLSLFAGIMNGSYAAFLKKVTLPTDFINTEKCIQATL
jgi:hypothetical protein